MTDQLYKLPEFRERMKNVCLNGELDKYLIYVDMPKNDVFEIAKHVHLFIHYRNSFYSYMDGDALIDSMMSNMVDWFEEVRTILKQNDLQKLEQFINTPEFTDLFKTVINVPIMLVYTFVRYASAKAWDIFYATHLKYGICFTHPFARWVVWDIVANRNSDLLQYFMENKDTNMFYSISIDMFKDHALKCVTSKDTLDFIEQHMPLSHDDLKRIVVERTLHNDVEFALYVLGKTTA